ncbi:glutathione peroxidase [Erwinia sp. OLTSP20]|uniref:glutathione peroxidase n=1 Tax=unclassified Erwinia TaxID=2622719 RepID=UPI000C183D4C|nr:MULTISPECIES: glutathione peroxidase [unclassified Erwinia]PIJ51843.1 glutathione peroxidase [Erwinia sp. OAMSP11]PIJ74431.1 glutathione peroxidase [Erwinia sp. OLSSP12]PIJ83736.1 glutathione peroxidase [Erwinia sp. OLCASP19]PIJ86779.1 glutathione peroxidase [Erwinia sp. OLMTSP26]PIJ88186.1 glutathione peroxidase [Erwinia sp. OLMDSP33]
MDLYATPITMLDGENTTLGQWQGSVLLLVNVASKCGLTPQYAQLEALQKKYHQQGFNVIGFPCNQFLEQEPGSEQEIKTFCSTTYGITFPMSHKIDVNGPHRHPLYQQLVAAQPAAIAPADSGFLARMVSKGRAPKQTGDILWNFEKFLVNRHGVPNARFSPDMLPDDQHIIARIEQALSA